ncbi:MAG: efflux transporter outer membrane subunit [Kiritimatiellae bacterium]|nr:efflux transporter outer membrane subunit [Kiritimatiellia bacterium]
MKLLGETFAARHRALFALAAAAVAGCTLGPDFERPQPDGIESFAAFRHGADDARRADAESISNDSGWQRWHDPLLVRLVQDVCGENLSLAQTVSRVREARATLEIARAAMRPSLGLSGSAAASRVLDPSSSARSARGGGEASWEIDLFGANRRAAEAALAQYEATEHDESFARLSLQSEMAAAVVELRLAEAMLAISRGNLDLAGEALDIARSKDEAGLTAGSGLAASEAAAASSRASVADREAAASAAARAIEILLAKPPFSMEEELRGAETPSGDAVCAIPAPPPLAETTPAEVVARRPDVLKAEATLHAATAQIGSARAARYPAVNIAGGVSVSASSVNDWSRTTELSIGPSVSIPLFRGGALAAAEEKARAAADTALLAWRDAVVAAIHEAQNAWTRVDAAQSRKPDLAFAAEKDEEALDAALSLWKAGSGSYENVISRRQALLSARQSLAQNEAEAAEAAIALYKALGGAPD